MTAQTLLLTLAGPQQAWGSRSRFAIRDTERAPTRSGVIGLIAAAMGMGRTESLDRFTNLRFGVRIDRPGRIERDFQTARTFDGKKSMPLSQRRYLADAIFLAGLETGDREFLHKMEQAIRRPRYPLYLGRRAFPPAGPIPTEIVAKSLTEALRDAPHRSGTDSASSAALEILVDARPGEPVDMTLDDVPVSFDPRRRRYGRRDVRIIHTPSRPNRTDGDVTSAAQSPNFALPPHDPMLLVSDEEV